MDIGIGRKKRAWPVPLVYNSAWYRYARVASEDGFGLWFVGPWSDDILFV